MRNIFKLCLLVLTVAACLESAKAQEVPPGTYRETCVNIRVRYGTLYATAKTGMAAGVPLRLLTWTGAPVK